MPNCLALAARPPQAAGMFMVDEEAAAAIRQAWDEGGELSAVVELRRRLPRVTDGENGRQCVRTIVGWTRRPAPDREQASRCT